jgi:hypothetical protein
MSSGGEETEIKRRGKGRSAVRCRNAVFHDKNQMNFLSEMIDWATNGSDRTPSRFLTRGLHRASASLIKALSLWSRRFGNPVWWCFVPPVAVMALPWPGPRGKS